MCPFLAVKRLLVLPVKRAGRGGALARVFTMEKEF
jgi:hypothetical protein